MEEGAPPATNSPEVGPPMVDLQTLLDADEARKKLWAIPGVVRIGFGLKETAGEAQPQNAFRVYVLAKRPLDEIAPAERIPPEIDGIPTDVIVLGPRIAHCSSALKPGLEISREMYGIQGSSGSIGCFVQKGGHFYILTNQHVFVPDQGGDVRPAIYQPSRSAFADVPCNKPVAHVVGEVAPNAVRAEQQFQARTYWVDCGVVQLNDGVAFENTIPDIGAVQQTVRDLVAETMSPVPAPPGRPGVQARPPRQSPYASAVRPRA